MPNHEFLKVSDKTALPMKDDTHDSVYAKLAREAYVIGSGLVGGALKEGWREAVNDPWGSGLKLAGSVGVGLALGYAQRGAGLLKLGGEVLGGAMGISFAADVLSPRRWSAVRDTLSDTWSNKSNTDRNVALMEQNLGRFAFDSGMMLAGGMAGAKLGQGLHGRLGSLKASLENPFGPAMTLAEVPLPVRVSERFDLGGRRFGADTKGGTPWDQADAILKPRRSFGLDEMGQLKEKLLVGSDAEAIRLKGEVQKIAQEGATVKDEINKLSQERQKEDANLKRTEGLVKEKQDVQHAERSIEALQQQKSELPQKEEQLRQLGERIQRETQSKEAAKAKTDTEGDTAQKGKGQDKDKKDKGEKKDTAPKEDLKAKAKELRAEIGRIKADTDETNPSSAINQARVRHGQALESLTAAEGKLTETASPINDRIAEIDKALGGRQEVHRGLGEQLREAIGRYEARVSELKADPSKLVEVKGKDTSAGGNKQAVEAKDTTDSADKPTETASIADKPQATVKPAETVNSGSTIATGDGIAKQADKGVIAETKDGTGSSDNSHSAGGANETSVVPVKAAEPVQEVKNDATVATSAETVDQTGKSAEKPVEVAKTNDQVQDKTAPEADKAKEVTEGPEALALKKTHDALSAAKDLIQERQEKVALMEDARARKTAIFKERAEIASGKKTFEDEAAKAKAQDELKSREAAANADLARVGTPQYARPMKAVNEYAKACEEYLGKEPSEAKRDAFAKEAVNNLEDMLDGIQNSRNGVKGEKNALSPRQQAKGMAPEKRLAEIREHLDKRVTDIDGKRAEKVATVTDQVQMKAILDRIQSGDVRTTLSALAESTVNPRIPADRRSAIVADAAKALYDNSTVAFFENGKLVQNTGTDAQLHQQLVDVARCEQGQGRLDRFIGHKIDGYALVVPKLRTDGKLMEISRRGGGGADKPVYAKEVLEVGGTVPEGVQKGTSFGEVLKKYRGEPEVAKDTTEPAATSTEPSTEGSKAGSTEVVDNAGAPVTDVASDLSGTKAGTETAYAAVAPDVSAVQADTTIDASPTGDSQAAPETNIVPSATSIIETATGNSGG